MYWKDIHVFWKLFDDLKPIKKMTFSIFLFINTL